MSKKCKKKCKKICIYAIFAVILQSQFEVDMLYILYKQ